MLIISIPDVTLGGTLAQLMALPKSPLLWPETKLFYIFSYNKTNHILF